MGLFRGKRKMKRGVDEDKSMGPMFPRVHVNDTDKGGPRAPPRNKMALYEQLSIPSQRFSGGPNSSTNNVPPPLSSSQGGASERGSFPVQQPPSTHAAYKTTNRYSSLNNQLVQQEQKKKQEERRVPIFVQQSGVSLDCIGNNQNKDNEGPSPFSSAFSGRLINIQQASERNNSQDIDTSASNQSSGQRNKVRLEEINGSSNFGHRNASNNSIRLQSNVNLRDHLVDSQADNPVGGNSISNEAIGAVGYGNPSWPVRDSQQEMPVSTNGPINGDAISETSMVDSISEVDVSPDDAVGIIGQKHFWRARRAIVNQQRVFDVQVFELHRLIKVQRLIAALPQLMVEADASFGKPANVSPIKKIPLVCVLKPTPDVPKLKDCHEKPKDDTREFSAENAVEKASLSSVQNSSQSMFPGYPLPPFNPKMGSWSMNQLPGHQLLIPVMSPSEGLIYKPYPGPGYVYPGPRPPGPAPVIGHDFVNYGFPPTGQPRYEWPSGFRPGSHGYFPPSGMPTMNSCGGNEKNPFNMQYPVVTKLHTSNGSEVQVSTASSPRDEDTLPLSPPQPARVIRVVPHDARLATESVAWIFQSIQEEREQHDSV